MMLKRDALAQLLLWKSSPRRKPLIFQGARQVGKTYLLKHFGKTHFKDIAYFNFERTPALLDLFKKDLNPEKLIEKLSIHQEAKIAKGETLIVFDEIQLSDGALTSLKYFCEDAPQYFVVGAGSLLGVKLRHQRSFPVGKVNFLNLYPMTFSEFLSAMGKVQLREFVSELKTADSIPEPIHDELLDWLKKYLIIGGMPEAVAEYQSTRDFHPIREIQHEIVKSYENDFLKYSSPEQALKISNVWEALPAMLARENKKFTYSHIGKSARAREFETAIQWLSDAGLIHKCHQVTAPKLPLEGYKIPENFKIYFGDVGLLSAKLDVSPKHILENAALFQEYKGALAENFVAQELRGTETCDLFYWQSQNQAEVDYLIPCDEHIIPLEVKSGTTKGIKSLREYQKRFHCPRVARVSLNGLRKDDDFINVPLYCVSRIQSFLKEA